MKEADITISGVRLSDGQSMALRVSIQNFAAWLNENGLGKDASGKALTKAYLARLSEINKLIMETAK